MCTPYTWPPEVYPGRAAHLLWHDGAEFAAGRAVNIVPVLGCPQELLTHSVMLENFNFSLSSRADRAAEMCQAKTGSS